MVIDIKNLESRGKPVVKGSYRKEIDGLRALAVIAVIINHFNKELLPSGFLGVDIFFVISGYVITSSIAGREYKSWQDFLFAFYNRRVKRIIPPLLLCVAITSPAIFFFVDSIFTLRGTFLKTGVTSLFGLSNLYLFKQSVDYFAASTDLNPFTHTWSLAVEEQFYLVFPVIIWISGFARRSLHGKRVFFWAMTLLSLASLIVYVWLSQVNLSAAYFLMPSRFWEMGIGCITFLLIPIFCQRQPISQIGSQFLSMFCLVLIIASLFLPQVQICRSTIAIVLLTAGLIINIKSESFSFKLLTWKPFVFVGLISYSLYLWHWIVLVIGRWTIGIEEWTVPIQIGLMFGLAWLSYRYIEIPLRHANWSVSRFLTIGYGVSAALLLSFLIFFFFTGTNLKSFLYLGQTHEFLMSPWGKDTSGNHIENCHAKLKYSENLFNTCIIENEMVLENAKPNIYIFGDSHAHHYVKGITKSFPEYRVKYMTMSGCAFIPEKAVTEELEIKTNCKAYIRRVKHFAQNQINANDVVFIGFRYGHASHEDIVKNPDFLFDIASPIQKKGGKFVLMADVPEVPVPPLMCAKQPWRTNQPKNCFKTIANVLDEQVGLDMIGTRLTQQFKNSSYLDVRKHLCDSSLCSLYKGEMLLYYDQHHITEQASEMLAPYIRNQLKDLLL